MQSVMHGCWPQSVRLEVRAPDWPSSSGLTAAVMLVPAPCAGFFHRKKKKMLSSVWPQPLPHWCRPRFVRMAPARQVNQRLLQKSFHAVHGHAAPRPADVKGCNLKKLYSSIGAPCETFCSQQCPQVVFQKALLTWVERVCFDVPASLPPCQLLCKQDIGQL